jgi:hypothetical protein
MIGDAGFRLFLQVLGYALPGYLTFKDIEHGDGRRIELWCMYWCVISPLIARHGARGPPSRAGGSTVRFRPSDSGPAIPRVASVLKRPSGTPLQSHVRLAVL